MRDNIWDLSTTKKTTKLNILYGLVGGRIRWLGRQMYAVGAKQYTFSKPRNQVDILPHPTPLETKTRNNSKKGHSNFAVPYEFCIAFSKQLAVLQENLTDLH